jgi:histidine triad (HIT) family protein
MNSTCIFCSIIARKIPATIVKETKDILVIKDINPKAPIHYLIITKKHIENIQALEPGDKELVAQLPYMAQELSRDLPAPHAFKLVSNNGKDAGQHVFHMHIHFLSGKHFDF